MIEHLYSYDEVDSTNEVAKRMVNILNSGDIIWAIKQSAGRGKGERVWYSPEGGLWFSIIFKPSVLPRDPNIYTKMMAVSIVRVLGKSKVEGIGIKWPNDIYYHHKKLGGILTEIIHYGSKKIIIVGAGINVNNDPPKEVGSAISLRQITGKEWELSRLLRKIHSESINLHNYITKGQRNLITNLWRNYIIFKKGTKVKLIYPSGIQTGTVVNVFSDYLVVERNGIKERVKPSEVDFAENSQ
ncbi:biotin--[acetyl-CoA-carboxylase] ligase [Athalassotoga saccharophila]|uniref:biotin--[acetyl-CoA-carboxylase] ligase n=1 Tax=Athalassotoga saccharophila TaxID=1441386 RepID=UPI001379CD6F|nr:biotin--[acetyl-CoA-carboxylase] ligase [Athalassotoga saccharophila]BBJ28870.1 bifunctional ligase/repressor BirA [Athalassotoga saccharophila]